MQSDATMRSCIARRKLMQLVCRGRRISRRKFIAGHKATPAAFKRRRLSNAGGFQTLTAFKR
jgi:hypothetical protein